MRRGRTRSRSSAPMRAAAGPTTGSAGLPRARSRASTGWSERTERNMSDCKTGVEHIKSLKDGRTVYIEGKLVPDVTEHPAFRNSVRSAASLYDYQARPENIEAMTFQPEGSDRRVNRAWQMPRNHEEMVQR